MLHAVTPAVGRAIALKVLEPFHTCPVLEIARLGRTLRSWRAELLAYFNTGGISNGGTEAINLIIEKSRRRAHGFRNFANYRIRILLAADGTPPGGVVAVAQGEATHPQIRRADSAARPSPSRAL